METNSILTANVLDIIFEGRNKDYGAYELRNTYNKRISTALGITAIIILIFIVVVMRKNGGESKSIIKPNIDLNLSKDREKDVPPPPPLAIPKPILVRTIANPPPIIVKDNLVTKPPLEVKELADARIGTITNDGENDKGIIAPVEIKNSLVLEAPKAKVDDGLPFIRVEIEAQFNGNWNVYLQKEIEKNIDELTEEGISGTCIVRFVVSKDGTVSHVEAITMKGTKLAELAVNAIRKGPKWIPAIQNGVQVIAYREQPVTFKITD